MAKVSRFKLRDSDRSGFIEREVDLIRDKGFLVSAEEYDTPPPSEIPLGGEGDLSGDPRSNSTFTITNINTPINDKPTYYITVGGGISPDLTTPWMNITGSNGTIDITKNPQISSGKQNDILTLFCTDSSIKLDHGTGLNMMSSAGFTMTSGSIITFIYSSGNTAWNETSRYRP